MAQDDDGLAQAFVCLWRNNLNGTLLTPDVTDNCFSDLGQTQLIIDIKNGLNIAFSQPGLSSSVSESVESIAASVICLNDFNDLMEMTSTEKSTRETVIDITNACFPSNDSTTQKIVAGVISSFDILALSE